MKMIGLFKRPNGATGAMWVYGCCRYHMQLEWREYMKRYPELNVMYVRPVRLNEHKLYLPEFYAVPRECLEGRNNE